MDRKRTQIFIAFITLPFIIFWLFVGWSIFREVPPVSFDFMKYSGHVSSIEIVDWESSEYHLTSEVADNYRVIFTLQETQYEDLLKSLTEVDFQKYKLGDPPGFGGRCFLITLDDGTYLVIGRHGYAYFHKLDTHLERYTNLWNYIEDYDFVDLFEPYLGR